MPRLPDRFDTERLVLRRWELDDAEALHDAETESRYHLIPWMSWASTPPRDLDERRSRMQRWTDEWESGGDVLLGGFREGVAVGGAGLHRKPDGLEIGYWTHVNHVRNGYATEMAEALTDAAFSNPDVNLVSIRHDRANKPSAGIPRALGFAMSIKQPQTPSDPVEYIWRMTKQQWSSRDGLPMRHT